VRGLYRRFMGEITVAIIPIHQHENRDGTHIRASVKSVVKGPASQILPRAPRCGIYRVQPASDVKARLIPVQPAGRSK